MTAALLSSCNRGGMAMGLDGMVLEIRNSRFEIGDGRGRSDGRSRETS